MLGKKAQVGETMTWVVATIIIIVILGFSLFIAGASDLARGILNLDKRVEYNEKIDRVSLKSLNNFMLTEVDNERVYDYLKDNKALERDDVGELSKKVFMIYNESYNKIWFGVSTLDHGVIGSSLNGKDNLYFGKKPGVVYAPGGNIVVRENINQMVWLDDNYYAELLFIGKNE